MRRVCAVVIALCTFSTGWHCHAQDISALNQQWQQTMSAVQKGNNGAARALLAQFTASAAAYVRANGRNWQIEYLVGSADCMFPDQRKVGAEFLKDILANNRSLTEAVQAELKRQLAACTGPAATAGSVDTSVPPDVTEVLTHYQSVSTQNVGISGNMKGGGGNFSWNQETAGAVSPISATELAARLVPVSEPQVALQQALGRVSSAARGAAEEGIAVVNLKGSEQDARLTGECLEHYAEPLRSEFQIQSSHYMITAYSVPGEQGVYEYAGKLHGLRLPIGVLAYSVPDDLSLVSSDSGERCGSMAHELVHLLIRQNFLGAPAWLEEGLASEVAVASPSPQGFRFGWSWRDDRLVFHDTDRMSIGELLEMPWSGLNAYDHRAAVQAEINQALVAVFIRYLDSKGKLPAIYFAVRDQHLSPDLQGFKSYREILENNMGMSVSAIDADFKAWFKAETAANTTPSPNAPANAPNMSVYQGVYHPNHANEAPNAMRQPVPASTPASPNAPAKIPPAPNPPPNPN